jgi:hypothetical protein
LLDGDDVVEVEASYYDYGRLGTPRALSVCHPTRFTMRGGSRPLPGQMRL